MPRLPITMAAILGSSFAFAAAWLSRHCGLEHVKPSSPTEKVASSSELAVVVDYDSGLLAHDCFGPPYRDSILGILALVALPLVVGLLLRPNLRAPRLGAGLLGALFALTFSLCLALFRGRSNFPLVVFAILILIAGLAAVLGSWIRSRMPSNTSLERTREG